MKITFNPEKNAKNMAERGLSFERAADFDFDDAEVWEDDRFAYPETRYLSPSVILVIGCTCSASP